MEDGPEDTHSLLSPVRAVDKGAMHTTSPDRAPSSSSPASTSTALLVAATVALVVSLAGVIFYNFSDALFNQMLALVHGRQDLTAISIAASDGHPSSHPGEQRSMTPMIRDPPSV